MPPNTRPVIVERPDLLAELEEAHKRLAQLPSKYLDNPAGWVTDRIGESIWTKQGDILGSIATHRRTAVKSCHGVGKSWTAARAAAWWLEEHPPGSAFVVTTAPTFPQVRAILWKEINRAHKKGSLTGKVNQTEWWINGEIVAMGRKPSDYDEAAFQGVHARYVLVILDEAGGIPADLWVAANALVTNDDSRMLAIGNPDNPSSHFAKICTPGSGWNVLQISAYDSPNFTDEVVPDDVRHVLVSQAYLDDLISDGLGPGTPVWEAKVLGEFPRDDENSVVRYSKITECRREGQEHDPGDLLPVELGVDVGGSESGDATVIRERRGCRAGRVWRIRSSDSAVVANEIKARILETQCSTVKIDSIGIGWGVAGHLNAMKSAGEHAASIVKVNVGSASSRPTRFPKLRDEIWWEIGRMMTEEGRWDLSEIDDRTMADLVAPRWSPDTAGRIQIEPKKETKKRLGRSPDDADALLLAFFGGSGQGHTFMEAWSGLIEADKARAARHGAPAPQKVSRDDHMPAPNPHCKHHWFAGVCTRCAARLEEIGR